MSDEPVGKRRGAGIKPASGIYYFYNYIIYRYK